MKNFRLFGVENWVCIKEKGYKCEISICFTPHTASEQLTPSVSKKTICMMGGKELGKKKIAVLVTVLSLIIEFQKRLSRLR